MDPAREEMAMRLDEWKGISESECLEMRTRLVCGGGQCGLPI